MPGASKVHGRRDDGNEVIDVFRHATMGRIPVDQAQAGGLEAVADRAGEVICPEYATWRAPLRLSHARSIVR